ncbi:MAG: hypothetical protein ACREA9_22045 [Pyrinomonadaceae bacterium]
MKRTTPYLSLALAGLALTLLLLAPFASGKTKAEPLTPVGGAAANASTTDEVGYWYFVVSYSETDKRITNTFYATGSSLKVYYKVRIALDGFQGDLEGTSFATREEADQDRAAKLPNAQVIAIADPLN